MKKYRLKIKYPGSHPVGTISKEDYSAYPEVWEEIIEKNYEILSFINTEGDIFRLQSDDVYMLEGEDKDSCSWRTCTYILTKATRCKIHSVKRLSDGEVFIVGDSVSATDNIFFDWEDKMSNIKSGTWLIDYYNTTIKEFKFIDDVICIVYSCKNQRFGQPLEFVKKLNNKPLFKTEDGVEVFKGDSYCKVNNYSNYSVVIGFVAQGAQDNYKGLKFSTKEAADEYVKMNKPEFSRNQIIEMLDKITNQNEI